MPVRVTKRNHTRRTETFFFQAVQLKFRLSHHFLLTVVKLLSTDSCLQNSQGHMETIHSSESRLHQNTHIRIRNDSFCVIIFLLSYAPVPPCETIDFFTLRPFLLWFDSFPWAPVYWPFPAYLFCSFPVSLHPYFSSYFCYLCLPLI